MTFNMGIEEVIAILDQHVLHPSDGLPDDLFYYISKITPLVNVDLLIKDENGRTLLSWRDDQYCGKGWHIPGGIVRFRETFETRIKKVAATEIGMEIIFEKEPIAIKQCINRNRDIRGHFISILFKCFLSNRFVPQNKKLSMTDAGYLMWHDTCPDNLLSVQEMYRNYINQN